jgi:hypothetical protein
MVALPTFWTVATGVFFRIGVAFITFSTIGAKISPMRKPVAVPITKGSGDVFTILSCVGSFHNTVFDIALASVEDSSIVGCPFLDAGASIETSVIVSSACDVFDFALQSGVAFGTCAVHSVVVQFLFEWKRIGLGIDPGVGSKLAMSVSTNTVVVTVKITRPVVCVHNAIVFRHDTNGEKE